MNRLALSACLVFVAACDGGSASPTPPPVVKPPPEFPALPDIQPAEDFSKDDFLELPAGEPLKFSWDLSENVGRGYAYEQESHLVMTATAGAESGKIASRTQWKGDAKVVGGGNGRGELVFVSSPIAQWNNNKPLSSEELNKVPKVVAQYMMKESGFDGAPIVRSGQEDPKMALYFAMPSRELKPGETETLEVHLANVPEDLKYHGRQEITHAGRRKVGQYECVKLRSRLELDVIPPGDGNGRLTGWIAAYYAPKERMIVRAEAAIVMAVDVRREMRPADPKADTYWQMNRAQADTRVTIVLKD